MATTRVVPVAEYLHSTFEPGAEYVEGRIVLRAMPKKPHRKLQTFPLRGLDEVARPLGYEVWVEQHLQTKRNRPATVLEGLVAGA